MRELTRFGLCLALATAVAAPIDAQRITLDSTSRATWAALLAVHDARSADTLVVDRALASPVAELRAAAARVVGTNRIGSRYALLRQRLQQERDSSAARDAAFALGLAADTASCGALQAALLQPATDVAAAWSLGELGGACGSFAPLLTEVRRSSARAALLRVAGKWSPFPDSVVVNAFTSATDPAERWAALYALARARRAAGVPLALEATRSPDPALRDVAARLLVASLQSAMDSARTVARLETLVQRDPAPHVRVAAVRALATYRAPARLPLHRAWQRERDGNVRVALAQSVASVFSATDSLWRVWWQDDTTHMVRRSIIASAWTSGAIERLDGDSKALDTAADFRLRIAMIDGAASAGIEPFASRVALRLTDSDARVRAAAVSALGRLRPELRESLALQPALDAAVQDSDAGVRTAALALRRRDQRTSDAPSVSADSARPKRDPAVTTAADYDRIVREVIVPSLGGRAPSLRLETDRGAIQIALDGVSAPMTSDHLLRLARAGYFRDFRFHRVVPAFVAQGGDPRGDGTGGPGFAIRDELNRHPYVRGAVGMALSGPDTGGSQFFLTLAAQPHLDGHYTVFGRVRSGAAAMDALVQGDRIRAIVPVPQ